ncbi:Uncharacterised protein [Mycobacterium tuberculosis]|uniref:Uncharacterized protein n=1 Tax=Mycobacterium tuberculosis TaxID=1773 RepID=A0A655JQ07_MYCTX|nr:Uncharacterised protein [Mycobacterium tuberculosis]
MTVGARESRRCTAVCVCHTAKLSSRISSGFSGSTASSCSSESTSTSHGRSGAAFRTARSASTTDPAAATWLSLISAASPNPSRWLTPPPVRTAYFCSARRPGSVLRVSRIFALVPRTASTHAAVAVAIPDR